MLVHGKNLEQKENHQSKYNDPDSRRYLAEIRAEYDAWKKANDELRGPTSVICDDDFQIIESRVQLLNQYKDFLDQQHYAEKFDSRSNLHSSVLEEFMYYLFRDLVFGISEHALIGKSNSFKDIFFRAESCLDMLIAPRAFVETKNHDFAIGVSIIARMQCEGSDIPEDHNWDLPAVAIECKTYLDKTMLQDVATAAEQLKQKNPNALYIVVAEWLKLTESVNLKKYKIDQIYVLRKQKNTDRGLRYDSSYCKNPIYSDAVIHCFNYVRDFLTHDWQGSISHGLNRGFLI
ncbi:MAG: Bpu10I family restriction endonuclease [Oscillatoriales cyanobacterium]|nr:MAG: Bpu10I family restriction endonuclease [Oscillatoriales cyanobacterium]